jgi:hypothetical protein
MKVYKTTKTEGGLTISLTQGGQVFELSAADAQALARDILARLEAESHLPQGLSSMATRILREVWAYKNRWGGNSPSQRDLAEIMGLESHRSLEPYLKELEEARWLMRPVVRSARGFDWGGAYSPPKRPFGQLLGSDLTLRREIQLKSAGGKG